MSAGTLHEGPGVPDSLSYAGGGVFELGVPDVVSCACCSYVGGGVLDLG